MLVILVIIALFILGALPIVIRWIFMLVVSMLNIGIYSFALIIVVFIVYKVLIEPFVTLRLL